MNVDKLISLLDEPKVQEKIKSLFPNTNRIESLSVEEKEGGELGQRISDLELENKNIKKEKDEELSNSSSKIQSLTLQVEKSNQLTATKESEVESLTKGYKELKGLLDTANEKVNWYREHFSEDIKVQDIYSDLSEETKGSLSGIFKNTTLNGLIACGIQEKNIGNLWDYAKNEVVNNTNPDVTHIPLLFNKLFSRFTLAFPMYESQSVVVGDDFDTQLHIKHSSSHNASGVIDAVLLLGYVNTKTGKVIKQSIVRI